MLPVTSLYAGLLAVMLFVLSVHAIRGRIKFHAALGDGGHEELKRRIRVQANFCEYVPFILLLMVMAELQNASHILLHGMGILLVAGRLLHAYSILKTEPLGKGMKARKAGIAMTFLSLLLGAGYALYAAAMI